MANKRRTYSQEWDMETKLVLPRGRNDALEEEINSILAGSGADYRIEGIF